MSSWSATIFQKWPNKTRFLRVLTSFFSKIWRDRQIFRASFLASKNLRETILLFQEAFSISTSVISKLKINSKSGSPSDFFSDFLRAPFRAFFEPFRASLSSLLGFLRVLFELCDCNWIQMNSKDLKVSTEFKYVQKFLMEVKWICKIYMISIKSVNLIQSIPNDFNWIQM